MKWTRGSEPFWLRIPIQSDQVVETDTLLRLGVDAVSAWRKVHEVKEWPWPTGRVAFQAVGSTVIAKCEFALRGDDS